jgi:hypothetical protein
VSVPTSFQIAAFARDGSLVGASAFPFADLSPHWLAVWREALAGRDGSFAGSLHPNLDHIRLRVTWSGSVGMATSFVHGHLTTSSVFVSGASPAAEIEALELFQHSVARSESSAASAGSSPFADLPRQAHRPLLAVVVWGQPAVSNEDHELVAQLEWHLAGALFQAVLVASQ